MRVAVLADIHGNLPALEAVLADPDVAAADCVVLLGDIALGPMPAESLDLLASLGERAVWVHGNCEREVVTAYDGKSLPGPDADGARATAALLDEHHRDLLGRRVVNPGSVGMPYGATGACWALLGPTVQLCRTQYDVAAAAARIRSSAHPDAAAWAHDYVLAPP